MITDPKNVKIATLAELRAAAPRRLPGYLDECLRRGQLDDAAQTVTFTVRDFNEIRHQYNPRTGATLIAPGCCG